jgi:OmpA-OmpF porin, OOP family
MTKFYQIIIILILYFVKQTKCQNLVPNPSFENFIECPDTTTLSYCENLDSTWHAYYSSDYFNECDTYNFRGIPINDYGFQFANSGNAYAGVVAYYTPSYSVGEYLQIQLTSALSAGQIYYVQFYVNLADISRYAIVNMGAMFTDTLFDLYSSPISSWSDPQIENAGTMLSDSISWFPVNGSFIANGGERYLTLGNFQDEAGTVKQYLGGSGPLNMEAYYYIDDVYVGTTQPLAIPENKKGQISTKIYPNPSTDKITIDFELIGAKNNCI